MSLLLTLTRYGSSPEKLNILLGLMTAALGVESHRINEPFASAYNFKFMLPDEF